MMLESIRESVTKIMLTADFQVAPPPQPRELPKLPEFMTGHVNPLTGEENSNDGDGSVARAPLFGALAGSPMAAVGPGGAEREDPYADQNINRNAPCPCGSGNKYKHCHGAV